MIPKKASNFILPTAKATDSSEELVKAVTSFYWTEVRKSLIEMRGHNIFVEGLGTFRVKHWKIPEVEAKYAGMLGRYQEMAETNKLTFQRFAIKKEIEIRLERVQRLQKMIDADKIKKEQVKQKRDESTTKDLPGQEENN